MRRIAQKPNEPSHELSTALPQTTNLIRTARSQTVQGLAYFDFWSWKYASPFRVAVVPLPPQFYIFYGPTIRFFLETILVLNGISVRRRPSNSTTMLNHFGTGFDVLSAGARINDSTRDTCDGSTADWPAPELPSITTGILCR